MQRAEGAKEGAFRQLFEQAEQARETINPEVRRQTNDAVLELIPHGVIVPRHTFPKPSNASLR